MGGNRKLQRIAGLIDRQPIAPLVPHLPGPPWRNGVLGLKPILDRRPRYADISPSGSGSEEADGPAFPPRSAPARQAR